MVCEIAKRVGKRIVVFKGEKKCSDNKREGASASSFFCMKKNPPSGSFLQGELSKFGQPSPKQIVLYMGIASMRQNTNNIKTEGKRLQLPLSY